MALFMKAGSIEGSVKTEKHKGWITVDSCKVTITADLKEVSGEGADRTVEPELGEMEIEKPAGGSSPALLSWMLGGEALPEVVIEVCRESGDWYLRHVLRGVVLKEFSMNVRETGESGATLKLKYDELEMEQAIFSKEGKKEGGAHRSLLRRGSPARTSAKRASAR